MAELIAINLNLKEKSSEYYTAGILSMLDAYLDRPLAAQTIENINH